jgi:hypothetical protein
MVHAFRFALAIASLVTVVAGATVGAGQAGRLDQMDQMDPMDPMNQMNQMGQMGQMGQMSQMNELRPYTAEAVKSAMAEGKTTLLFFHAPWCPVCRAQEPKVNAHLNGAHRDIAAFKVDYDSNTALRKELKVDKQSTLILYRGTKEVARLSYKSDDASIAEFFSHASMMHGAQ